MPTNLHSEFQPLQAQSKLNVLEQAILDEKARCEAIRAEILSCEEKIKSINEAWLSWGKEDELFQLQQKRDGLVLQEKQSQERLAKLTADVAQEEEQQIKAQEKQRAEALRTLQGLLIEQQRQEKQKLTYSKYGFEILENEAALNEINASNSIIYIAPVAKEASGQSTNRYVCKVFPPHDEKIVDVKPVILFYIEAGDVYDIIHFRVGKQLLRKEFELLQKQQFNSQDDAIPMIDAYLEKINAESLRCKKKPTLALEWLWKKDMGEFRQELRDLKIEAERLLREAEVAEVAKIESTTALFKARLAKASNREEVDGWNIAFSIAIAKIKSAAVRTALDKIRETEFSLRVSEAFLTELSTLDAKVSVILEKQQKFPAAADSKTDFRAFDVVVELNQKIKEIKAALAKARDEDALKNLRKANDIAERLLIDLQDAFEENEDNTAYPLHNAVSNGETLIVKMQLNGLNDEAKIKAAQEKNARGHTLLDVAIVMDNLTMVELLFELIPTLDSAGMSKERALEKLQNMHPKVVFNPEESSSEGQKIKQKQEEQKIVLDFKATLHNLEEQAKTAVSVIDCEKVIKDIEQYCISLQNVMHSVDKEKLNELQAQAQKLRESLRERLNKVREVWMFKEAGDKHRDSCKLELDVLLAAFEDPNADKEKLSADLSKYVDARQKESESKSAQEGTSKLFNPILLSDLLVLKQEAEKLKILLEETELDKKRTLAGYLFRPMPKSGAPELLENVIYFSIVDDCVVCQGLDLRDGKEMVRVKSPLAFNDQLIDRAIQRDVLNGLIDRGALPYSVQPDWEFSLRNLCDALNAVKEPINKRDDKFHEELANVGIFYENGKYILKLNEVKSIDKYRDYICNIDSLIAAELDEKAAQERDDKLKRLHAAQYSFYVYYPDVQDSDLMDAILEVQTFSAQIFQPKLEKVSQNTLIAEDIKYLEAYDSDARAKFKEARETIEEIKRQQQVLAKAHELQKICVEKITLSNQALQEEDEVLERQKKLEAQMKALVDDEKRIFIENDIIAQQLTVLLEQVNDKNDEFGQLSGKVRLEKDVRKKIKEAIDALISAHERFAIKPSLWIRFTRSPRSTRLAEWLEAIKIDLKKSDVSMSEIRAQLNTAIISFKDSEKKSTDLDEFEATINALPVLDSKNAKIRELAQKQKTIFSDQSKIMIEGISKLNQERTANDKTLVELGLRKISLQREMDELKPQVDAIQERRQLEKIENESLRRVKLLKRKSSSQQCLAEDDKVWASNFLALLQEQKAKKASREALLVSIDSATDKAEQLELSVSVNEMAQNQFVHEREVQMALQEIESLAESLDRADSERDPETNSLFATNANFFQTAMAATRRAFSEASMDANLASPLIVPRRSKSVSAES